MQNRASQCLVHGMAQPDKTWAGWKPQGKIHKFTKILADSYHRTPAKDATGTE